MIPQCPRQLPVSGPSGDILKFENCHNKNYSREPVTAPGGVVG